MRPRFELTWLLHTSYFLRLYHLLPCALTRSRTRLVNFFTSYFYFVLLISCLSPTTKPIRYVASCAGHGERTCVRTWTHTHEFDSFFAAKLRRES